MGTFSDRALAIQPTGVRKMFDLAGDDVISFGLGEPDFQPPSVAIEAFYQAMLDGRNKYTTTDAILLEADTPPEVEQKGKSKAPKS